MHNPRPASDAQPATDSPWFWVAVFGFGALLALFLTMPKYSWRQRQLERQFQARERAGQAVAPAEGALPEPQSGHFMISLRPLVLLFSTILILASVAFWVHRIRVIRGHRDPDRVTTNEPPG